MKLKIDAMKMLLINSRQARPKNTQVHKLTRLHANVIMPKALSTKMNASFLRALKRLLEFI